MHTAILTLALGALIQGGAQAQLPVSPPSVEPSVDTGAAPRPTTLTTVRVHARRDQRGYATLGSTSALRTDTPLRDTPRAVTVVTRRLIADQSMQSMADVVRYVPGVSMASGEGHRDAPIIRGNATTADFFVDGVRDDAQYLRDLYNVEQVEVLKGSDAMIFGRGGGGGVVNRVTRRAEWQPTHALTLEGGSFDHRRVATDVGDGFGARAAARLSAMYERSGGFRDAAALARWGVNPTAAFFVGPRTLVRAGFEAFDDTRRVDRGVPSCGGRPVATDIATFFGNPDVNRATSRVRLGSATIEHHTDGGLTLRNRVNVGDYELFYQNTLPGAVNADGTRVSLSAYNHALGRHNLYDGAEATYTAGNGAVRHTMLVGVELIRQRSSQIRKTGWYDDTTARYSAPLDAPTVATPVVFRQSATDADNGTVTHDAGAFAQDQIALGEHLQLVGGVRFERFAVAFRNLRTGQALDRADRLVSPRGGVIVKPVEPLSLYGSYGVSWLPSSGDQFSTLTVTTATLEPEKFVNREVGAKWDAGATLAFTGAVYRLDRTYSSAPDPVNPGLVVQTGAQRTTGWELGLTGSPAAAWQLVAGVGSQHARIVSTTTAAKAGATVALVPSTSWSLWNRYEATPRVGVGLGVVGQTKTFAAVDDAVTLPGFTRLDGALYLTLRRDARLQVNVENLLDARYFATSQGNNNIMPGAPRTVRVGMVMGR